MVDDDKARRFAEVALERTGRGPLTDKEVAEDMKRTIDTSELGPIKIDHEKPTKLSADRIAEAINRTIEREHPGQQPYFDNLGDGDCVIIDGVLNLRHLAEELEKEL